MVNRDPDPNIERRPPKGGKYAAYHAGRAARDEFCRILREDPRLTVEQICAVVGRAVSTYEKWRQRYPEFRYEVDAIRGADRSSMVDGWKGGFAAFRKQFFGMDSPWFHLEVVDALEHGEPGSITLILLPPEHGKSTLLTDYCCYKLALDPTFRISYGSEKQGHAIKIGNRIRNRMSMEGPAREYVVRWGPFAPTPGRISSQPWGTQFFNVQKKAAHDDQEYSWQAIGFGAAIAGTRSDLLIVDDVQSRKSLNLSKKILEEFRQDWLSRPGSKGRTVVIGTRVGDLDFYRELMDAVDEETGRPLVDRVIVYPAIRYDHTDVDVDEAGEPILDKNGNTRPKRIYLWPERYTAAEYDRMRRNAGPAAWARNYQQQPRDAGTDTFDEGVIEKMNDDLHAWEMPIPNDMMELAITLDPAIGGHNAFTVQGWAKTRLIVLDTSGDWGLTSYDQIWTELENLLRLWHRRARFDGKELDVTTFVVEDKAFQKGLIREQRLLELQEEFGFAIVPHQTNDEKNDDIIGVTGMVTSARRKEIVLPAATDPVTVARIGPLRDELVKWRPRVKGTRLKQDKVMALWFGWLQWRKRRFLLVDTAKRGQPSGARPPLPWTPMKAPSLTGGQVRSPFRQLVKGR